MAQIYEQFFDFIGSWFPDMDLDKKNEQEIISDFKKTVSSEELSNIITQAEEVRNQIDKYWNIIMYETNIYFYDRNECLVWMDLLIKMLRNKNAV